MRRVFTAIIAATLLVSCASPTTSPSSSPTSPSPTASTQFETLEVFFVVDSPKGFRLVSELRDFPVSEKLAADLLAGLVSGEIQPLDPDYVNLWSDSNALISLVEPDGVLKVDLAPVSLNVGAEAEARAIEQLVWTVTAIEGNLPVQFTINGVVAETFAGHVDTSGPFERSETYEVLNDLQITYPNEGEQVSNPVLIQGVACTFEANVVWEVWSLDGIDTLIASGSTTAAIACPDRSGFEVQLEDLEPGSYEIRVMDYSAKDGSLSSIDTKSFSV